MYAFLVMLGLTQDVEARIKACLGSISKGGVRDWVSPIIPMGSWAEQDASRQSLMDQFWHRVNMPSLPKFLFTRECKERDKLGTDTVRRRYRSAGADGSSLQCQVSKFFGSRSQAYDHELMQSCWEHVLHTYGPRGPGLRAVPLDVAADSFDKSNLGFPAFCSDRRYLPLIKRESEYLLRTLDGDGILEYVALLWYRLQSKGIGVPAKARAIWQCSRVPANLEKTIQIPLLASIRHHPTFAAWESQTAVNAAVTELLDTTQWQASIDYSNFDATVSRELIGWVFDLFREWFTKEEAGLLELLQHYFNNIGLITPDGLESNRAGGIPSGCVNTNLVGTFANLLATQYAARKTGHVIKRHMANGDDGLIGFETQPDLDAMAEVLNEDLGMSVSPEKCFIGSGEAHYLQMIHHRDMARVKGLCPGVRSVTRVYRRMMNLDSYRPSWKPQMHTIRWRQQMGDSKYHPCFTGLLEEYLKHDKYGTVPIRELIAECGGITHVRQELGLPRGLFDENNQEALTEMIIEQGLRALT